MYRLISWRMVMQNGSGSSEGMSYMFMPIVTRRAIARAQQAIRESVRIRQPQYRYDDGVVILNMERVWF